MEQSAGGENFILMGDKVYVNFNVNENIAQPIENIGGLKNQSAKMGRKSCYEKPRNAIAVHCRVDGALKQGVIDSLGREKDTTFINEGNLYRLIMRSKLPSAEKFESWVVDEVLPTLRKTGSYSIQTTPVDTIIFSSDPLERCKALTLVLEEERSKQALIEARADKAEEAKAIAEQERDDVKEAFSRSVVSDNDKLYSTFIKELKMTNPCASSLLKELKIFGQNGHLSDYGDWFKVKVSDNGFPARFVTPVGQMMLVNLFNANRDKMRAIGGTYRYIKPQDRFKVIPEIRRG